MFYWLQNWVLTLLASNTNMYMFAVFAGTPEGRLRVLRTLKIRWRVRKAKRVKSTMRRRRVT